jgi:lipopolysaccharide/colanic/teichoic acid biosynthesis glycosyltransferase
VAAQVSIQGMSREADYIARPEFLDDLPATPFWKRVMDVLVASVALVVLSPLMVLVAVAIMIDSRGGAFYRQTRVGKGGRPFTCWKFRSMHRGADQVLHELASQNEAKGLIFKMRNDPRRTRMGRLVRKTSIDELPQLLNVWRGEMSLVGPRPPLLSEVVEYEEHHLRRLVVTPGITGLWQVTKRGSHDFEDMVTLDVEYARRLSLGLDLWILLRTVPTVLSGKGSY